MKKIWKRLCTGFLALATVVTALPTTPVHAESKQYWTESAERVGIIEKVMNDGSIGSTFNEGYMKVEGETAYCIDINTDFKNGYKTRADASSRMSADQISDVALSLEYVKQYGEAHKELNYKQIYLLEQCVVWQRLSVHLGWQCDNVRASYDEIPKATQDEVFSGARAFVKENKGRYECGGYIYSGEGQELGQFWAKLNVGNAKLKKASSNTSITDGNGNYSIAGATYGVFSDKDCTKQLGFYPEFTVKDYLLYISSIKGIKPIVAKKRVRELVAKVGLQKAFNKKMKNLSGGMKRRVGIAQAMLNNPQILILDEPTAGLDPNERIRFRNLISELAEERLVLLSTHIVSDVEYIANEILLMKDGQLIHKGTVVDLINSMKEYVWVCHVEKNMVQNLSQKNKVSNIKSDVNGVELRIISKDKPVEKATRENATLEDVFLYYFGEKAGVNNGTI